MNEASAFYNFQKFPWYSPKFVLIAVRKLARKYPGKVEAHREFKLAREMFSTAIALLGVFELHHDNKYFLQANLQSGSPDVMAVKLTQQESDPVLLEVTQVEVVTFEEHSPENNIIDFLKRTKLSPKKAYDERTIILCVVNKKIQLDAVQIHKQIRDLNPKSTIYILGKFPDEKDKWVIFSPFPEFIHPLIFYPSKTLTKYSQHNSVTLNRGSKKEILYEKTKSITQTIEEFFNIKADKLITKN